MVEEIETEVTLQGDDAYLTSAKEERLRQLSREMCSALVAFSGGVDSSYVAYTANSELGEKVLCIASEFGGEPTGRKSSAGETIWPSQRSDRTGELEDINYTANGPTRCYFCKDKLNQKLEEVARAREIEFILDSSTHVMTSPTIVTLGSRAIVMAQ